MLDALECYNNNEATIKRIADQHVAINNPEEVVKNELLLLLRMHKSYMGYTPEQKSDELNTLIPLVRNASRLPANAPAGWAGQKAALNANLAAARAGAVAAPIKAANRNLARASAAVLQRVGVPNSTRPNIVPNSIRRAAVNARSAKNAEKAAFTLSEAASEAAPAPALPIKTLSEGKQAGTEVGDDQLGGNRRTKKNRKGKKSKSRQKSESKSRTKSRPRTRSRRH